MTVPLSFFTEMCLPGKSDRKAFETLLPFFQSNMSLRGYISSIKVFNTFTADDECFRHKKENFPSLLQMQLSKTPKYFVGFFIAFLESTLNFEHLKKSDPYKL